MTRRKDPRRPREREGPRKEKIKGAKSKECSG
jgi:hypothetical protein